MYGFIWAVCTSSIGCLIITFACLRIDFVACWSWTFLIELRTILSHPTVSYYRYSFTWYEIEKLLFIYVTFLPPFGLSLGLGPYFCFNSIMSCHSHRVPLSQTFICYHGFIWILHLWIMNVAFLYQTRKLTEEYFF